MRKKPRASPQGRRRFAETLARAIRIYFVRQREDLLEERPAQSGEDAAADTPPDEPAEAKNETSTP
jgi:hypothetical protein